jgi:hypothetical protein
LLSYALHQQDLLEKVVLRTERYEVRQLEKLYALLCQSIYRHRREYNKATLLKVSSSVNRRTRYT